MSENQLSYEFHVNIFNALHSVEYANSAVRADRHIEEFLSDAAELFVSHNMHYRFGVALLHNHNKCNAGEHMLQDEGTVNGERALVTRPVDKPIDPRTEVPWVWTLEGSEFLPLEFTTDRAVRDRLSGGEVAPRFLSDFKRLVAASPIGKLIGLAITERTFVESAGRDEALVEFSNSSQRSNVIFLRKRSTIANSFETAWAFEGYVDAESGVHASTSCSATCRWECIIDYGKHSRLHFDHHIPTPD